MALRRMIGVERRSGQKQKCTPSEPTASDPEKRRAKSLWESHSSFSLCEAQPGTMAVIP